MGRVFGYEGCLFVRLHSAKNDFLFSFSFQSPELTRPLVMQYSHRLVAFFCTPLDA